MIAWIESHQVLTGLIISGIGVLALAYYIIRNFLIFVWAKGNQPAFELVLDEKATYIRKKTGQMIKIADHKYSPDELKQFRGIAMKAQKQAEEELKCGK